MFLVMLEVDGSVWYEGAYGFDTADEAVEHAEQRIKELKRENKNDTYINYGIIQGDFV